MKETDYLKNDFQRLKNQWLKRIQNESQSLQSLKDERLLEDADIIFEAIKKSGVNQFVYCSKKNDKNFLFEMMKKGQDYADHQEKESGLSRRNICFGILDYVGGGINGSILSDMDFMCKMTKLTHKSTLLKAHNTLTTDKDFFKFQLSHMKEDADIAFCYMELAGLNVSSTQNPEELKKRKMDILTDVSLLRDVYTKYGTETITNYLLIKDNGWCPPETIDAFEKDLARHPLDKVFYQNQLLRMTERWKTFINSTVPIPDDPTVDIRYTLTFLEDVDLENLLKENNSPEMSGFCELIVEERTRKLNKVISPKTSSAEKKKSKGRKLTK